MLGSILQSSTNSVAIKTIVYPAAAETALGTSLPGIQHEMDTIRVEQLFTKTPDAADLAQQYTVFVGPGGGLLVTSAAWLPVFWARIQVS
jgi:hypothetical protein